MHSGRAYLILSYLISAAGLLVRRLDLDLQSDGRSVCKVSVEAALACWAASFVACALVAAHPRFPPPSAFTSSTLFLCAHTATVSTVAEAASRLVNGTRHGLMPVGAAMVLLACLVPR